MKLLLVALCCVVPSGALAWEAHRAPDGQLLRFTPPAAHAPLVVRLVPPPAALHLRAPEGLRRAVVEAALAWQAVDTADVPVRWGGPRGSAPAPAPGEVVVSFEFAAAFPGGRDAAGMTELVKSGHSITAAHVRLNARDFDWATDGGPTGLDVQSVVEHELGHALGLAHPCGDTDTPTPSCSALSTAAEAQLRADVMYATVAPGPRRTLSPDDRAGVATLLPAAHAEPAPSLSELSPGCLAGAQPSRALSLQQLFLSPLPGTSDDLAQRSFQLWSDGAFVVAAPVSRAESGAFIAQLPASPAASGLIPQRLDALLVDTASGKAAIALDALQLSATCAPPQGCSTSGVPGALSLLVPLLFRRRRRALASRPGSRGAQASGAAPMLRAHASSAPARRFRGAARLRSTALAAVALCALAPAAHAFVRSKNSGDLCLWWATRGHSFQIDASGTPDVVGPAAFTAIRKSFAAWAAVPGSDLAFLDQGLSLDPKDRRVGFVQGQFNRNLVLWRTANCRTRAPPGDACLTAGGCGNLYDCWEHNPDVIATTTTTSNSFTGQIRDSDIELNDAPAADGSKFIFTASDGPACNDPNQTGCVRIDIQNTVTHEAGHSLGLDHSRDPSATMYATAPEGETSKRTLRDDDLQGIRAIYPLGQPTVTCLASPITLVQSGSSSGGGCSSPGAVSPLALLFVLPLLAGWQRRRRAARAPPAPAPVRLRP